MALVISADDGVMSAGFRLVLVLPCCVGRGWMVQGSWVKQKQHSARCRAGQVRSLGFQDYSLMSPFLSTHSGVTV